MSDNMQIIIKKSYFDNIQTVINSLNSFFSSNFKTKDFPIVDGDFQLDGTVMNILSWLNNVEPTWIENPEKIEQILDGLKDIEEEVNKPDPNMSMYDYLVESNNTTFLDPLNSYIGFKVLQFMADHFNEFSQLINGIYTFELFTTPSKYRQCLDIYEKPIPLDGIEDYMGSTEIKLYDPERYTTGVFTNKDQITIPDTLKLETEIERMRNCTDLQNVDIVMDDRVEEAAVSKYFQDFKPVNIRYDAKKDEFLISAKYKTDVDKMISELRSCNTTEDLIKVFSDEKGIMSSMIEWCSINVSPFILNKVFNSEKKFPIQAREEAKEGIDRFLEEYKSKAEKNPGAKRFLNYDLFTTFKTDKEGTLKFLRDFFTIDLYNYKKATISNNTLLTLFNIFDSRIYLDSLYNLIPEKDRKAVGTTEDAFVKNVRARINANSRAANVYKTDTAEKIENAKTTSDVMEYVTDSFKALGDMSTTDMQYCEQYHALLRDELTCINDTMYNNNVSQIMIDHYMTEAYDAIQEGFVSDFFKRRKLKKLETFQKETGLTFSKEYIDILTGDINIRSFAINTSLSIYHLFTNITKSSEKALFNNALVDIRSVAEVPASLKNELYPVGVLRYSHTLPRIDYPVIAADQTGNVYIVQHGLFNKVAESIREFVRAIVDKPVRVSIPSYAYQPNCATNKVEVNFPAQTSDAVNLRLETSFLEDDERGWYRYVTKVFYPELGKFCEDSLGFSGSTKTTVNADGSTTTEKIPFNASKVFKIVTRTYFNDMNSRVSHMTIGVGFRKSEKDTVVGTVQCIDGKPVKYDLGDVLQNQSVLQGMLTGVDTDKLNPETENITTGDSVSISQYDDIEPVTESFDFIQEVRADVNGDIPDYMRTRIELSDEENKEKPTVTPIDVNTPPDTPMNDINELCDSIDSRLSGSGALDDMLGSDAKVHPSAKNGVVYNITYNYSNSFNKDSYNTSTHTDNSTGKVTNSTSTSTNTNSHNDSSTNKKTSVDSSTMKQTSTDPIRNKGINNYNNSNDFVDSKDFKSVDLDKAQTFATGHTVQEVFAFLESEEPLSSKGDAGDRPKDDLLTTAMDRDRESMSKRQTLKKGVQKVYNTGRAFLKPVTRTKQQLAKVVNSLIKRDEEKVKAEIIENPSYRSTLFKAARLAIKIGAIGIATTINGYLGAALVAREASKLADKHRLKKEVQAEFRTEIEILDEKIELAAHNGNMQERWKLMRIRNKMQDMIADSTKQTLKSKHSIM